MMFKIFVECSKMVSVHAVSRQLGTIDGGKEDTTHSPLSVHEVLAGTINLMVMGEVCFFLMKKKHNHQESFVAI